MSDQPVANQPDSQAVTAAPGPQLRTVDLGREGHLVTWQEWIGRSAELMGRTVPQELHPFLHFRVTLQGGQVYSIRKVLTHVAKGACYPDHGRWSSSAIAEATPAAVRAAAGTAAGTSAVCNIITGYMLQGMTPDGRPTTLSVTPGQIASVECVLSPPAPQEEKDDEPFGFAAFMQRKAQPELEEVNETVPVPEFLPQTITGPGLAADTAASATPEQ